MDSHSKKENNLQACYEQGYFDPIVTKSPYCVSQSIFDSSCIGGNVVPSTPEKEVMANQTLERPSIAANAPPPTGLCDVVQFNNGQSPALQYEGKPVAANTSARRKRKRQAGDSSNEETDDFKAQLCSMLEANSQVLTAHLQSQNVNSQLDRNQRKEHMESLVGVLGKLADAVTKIADRL